MDEKELQALYNSISSHFDVGDFNSFKQRMSTPEQRKSFYGVVADKGIDLGDYNAYETRLAGKKKESSAPLVTGLQSSATQTPQGVDKYGRPEWLSKWKNLPPPTELPESTDPLNDALVVAQQKLSKAKGMGTLEGFKKAREATLEMNQVKNAFGGVGDVAKPYLDKALGDDANNYSDDELKAKTPNTLTGQKALSAVLGKRKVERALTSTTDFEKAAVKYYTGKENEFQGDVPDAEKGGYVYNFLTDPNVKELAKTDPNINQQYKEARYNFYNHFPSTANKIISQKIGQWLEDHRKTSWLYSNPSKEMADEAVDNMVKNGDMDEHEKLIYENNLRGDLRTLKSYIFGSPIPTSDLANSAARGINEGLSGMEATARDLLTNKLPIAIPFQNMGLIETNEDRTARLAQEQAATPQIQPKGYREFTSGAAHLMGFATPMILGSMAGIPQWATATAQFEGINADRSRQLFPKEEGKQQLYTLLTTGVDAALMEALPIKKAGQALKKQFGEETASIINDLSNKKISEAEAESLVSDKVQNLLSSVFKNNTSTASVMTGFNFAHNAIDAAFGKRDFNLGREASEAMKNFPSLWLNGTFLSALSANGSAEKSVNGRIIRGMADDPIMARFQIEQMAKDHPELQSQKEQAISNLDHAVKVQNELYQRDDLSERDKDKYMMLSLKDKILNEKAKAIPDKTLRADTEKELASNEIEKERILNPDMGNKKFIEEMYDNELLPKADMRMLEDENGKFNEHSVGAYLKYVAQQANNLDENWNPHTTKAPDVSHIPDQVIEAANERWHKEISAAKEKQPERGISVIMPSENKPPNVIEPAKQIKQFAAKSNRHFDYVPIEEIEKYKEHDREVEPQHDLDKLTEDIRQNGITTPIKLQVDRNGNALIVEGNTRLSAAKRLGIKNIPVEITSGEFGSINKAKAKELPEIGLSEKQRRIKEIPINEIEGAYAKGFTRVEPIKTEEQIKTTQNEIQPSNEAMGELPAGQETRQETGGGQPEGQVTGRESGQENINQDQQEKIAPFVQYPPTQLSYMGTGKLEREFGIEERTPTEVKNDAYTVKEADDLIASGKVPQIVNDAASGLHNMSDAEYVASTKYAAEVADKLRSTDPSSPEYNGYLDELNKIARAANISGRESGRELGVRGRFKAFPEGSYSEFMVNESSANNDAPLTDRQKQVANVDWRRFEQANKDLEEREQKFNEEQAAFRAEQELAKTKKSAPKEPKRNHDDFVKERKSYLKELKEAKQKHEEWLKSQGIQKMGIGFTLTPEMAKAIAKIVKSYVDEGVSKLGEIIDKVLGDIKEDLPEVEASHIRDVIAGEYNEPKITKREAAIRAENLRIEAKLLNKLEKVASGKVPKEEKAKVKRNQEIEDLRQKVESLTKEQIEKGVGEFGLKKINDLIKRNEREAAKTQEKIKKGDFAPAQKKQSIYDDKELQKRFPQEYKQLLESRDRLVKVKRDISVRRLRQIYENRSRTEKNWDILAQVSGIPRTLMASWDYSAPLRQGIISSISHPILATQAAKFMFQVSDPLGAGERLYNRWLDEVHKSTNWDLAEKSGLAITDPESLHIKRSEEVFQGAPYAEKIPFVGAGVKASERAYVGYLNHLRWNLFNMYAERYLDSGKTLENNPELYKGLASFINNATGRGGIGIKKMEEWSPVMNVVFFASKLIASRMNMLGLTDVPALLWQGPRYAIKGVTRGRVDLGGLDFGFYKKLPPELRLEAAKDMLRFIGVGSATLLLARQLGAQVEADPRNSDFGKIHVGDTRWDIWGGFQPYARVLTQTLMAERKNQYGRIQELNGVGYKAENRFSPLATFFRQKLAPVPGELWTLATGHDAMGQPVTPLQVLESNLPLVGQDIYQGIKDQGVKAIFTVGIPSALGVGVQIHNQNQPKPMSTFGGGGAKGSFQKEGKKNYKKEGKKQNQ